MYIYKLNGNSNINKLFKTVLTFKSTVLNGQN